MKCKETTVLFFMVILLGGFFFAGTADAKTKLKIPYTPFGGQIEKYKATSDAACVKESCGEVNEAIRKTVRGAIEAPATAICATISTPCAAAIGVGYAVCFASCTTAIYGAVSSINACQVEELKIGEPMPASVGILNIGSVKVFGLTIKLSDLFSGISVITPSIYDYKTSYKIEGRWALGDSLNIAGSCNSDDKPKWCKNPIIKIIMKSINKSTDKAGQDAYDKAINDGALEEDAQRASNDAKENYLKECPLLNLLHQMGSN